MSTNREVADWDSSVADLAFQAWLEIDWSFVSDTDPRYPRERMAFACRQIKKAVPMLREIPDAELARVIMTW